MNKILLYTVLASSFLYSCESNKNFSDVQKTEFRFVDLEGKPRDISTQTPILNKEAISKQQVFLQRRNINQNTEIGNKYAENNNQNSQELVLQQDNQILEPEKIVDGKNIDIAKDIEGEGLNVNENEFEYDLASENGAKKVVAAAAVAPSAKTDEDLLQKEEQQYILKKSDKNNIKKTHTVKEEKVDVLNEEVVIVPKGYFVQTGSFTSKIHAQSHLDKIKKISPKSAKFSTQVAEVNGTNYHRVVVGPFAHKKKALEIIKSLESKGQKAIIIKNK